MKPKPADAMNRAYASRQTCGDPHRAILAAMIISMVDDFTMKTGRLNMLGLNGSVPKNRVKFTLQKLRTEAVRDLKTFKDWPVYKIAMATGMNLPNDGQIRRLMSKDPKDIKRFLKDVKI